MTYSSVLADFEFFSDFSPRELALIGATGRQVTYPAGTRLFDEGAHAHGCWLLERGHIEIDCTTITAERFVLQTLSAGDVVGWSWLIPPYRWHFGAVTVSGVSAILLDTDRLRRFFDGKPELGYDFSVRVCGVLLQRLQASRGRLVEQSKSPESRVQS